MKLTELEAEFVQLTSQKGSFRRVESLADAQGVLFLCPKCFADNKGPVGTHSVICWFRGVSPEIDPAPGRWQATGTSMDDLTLSPSVWLSGEGGCGWHGWVKQGDAV